MASYYTHPDGSLHSYTYGSQPTSTHEKGKTDSFSSGVYLPGKSYSDPTSKINIYTNKSSSGKTTKTTPPPIIDYLIEPGESRIKDPIVAKPEIKILAPPITTPVVTDQAGYTNTTTDITSTTQNPNSFLIIVGLGALLLMGGIK